MGSSPVTHSSGSFCGLRWLRGASIFHEGFELRVRPVFRPGTVERAPAFDLIALPLDHGPPTLGWRLEEPEGRRRMLPERLDALGVRGFDVGRLQREGAVRVGGRLVTLEEVSQLRRGQRFAFLMDTRPCEAAVELARDSDLLVCECTYGANEENLAASYGHLTAVQAARIAAEAGVRRLVLTHFSQRYPDAQVLLEEALPIFADVVAARELDRIAIPPRR